MLIQTGDSAVIAKDTWISNQCSLNIFEDGELTISLSRRGFTQNSLKKSIHFDVYMNFKLQTCIITGVIDLFV